MSTKDNTTFISIIKPSWKFIQTFHVIHALLYFDFKQELSRFRDFHICYWFCQTGQISVLIHQSTVRSDGVTRVRFCDQRGYPILYVQCLLKKNPAYSRPLNLPRCVDSCTYSKIILKKNSIFFSYFFLLLDYFFL